MGRHATTATPVRDDEPATVKRIPPGPASSRSRFVTSQKGGGSRNASSSRRTPGSKQTIRRISNMRLILGPSEISTILCADRPARHSKGKLPDARSSSNRHAPDEESPTPLTPPDPRFATSDGSYELPKPVCGVRHARSNAVSEDFNVPSSALSANTFQISEDGESNPLYAPDTCLDQVRQIADTGWLKCYINLVL